MVRAVVYNPDYFTFVFLLFSLHFPQLNIMSKTEWCFQDRCELPWHGGNRQNAVHSRSREVSAPDHEQKYIYIFIHNHSTDIFCVTLILSLCVTVSSAVCLELISLNQKEESCWSCMYRLCFSAESAASRRNKLLPSCPSSNPSMRLI